MQLWVYQFTQTNLLSGINANSDGSDQQQQHQKNNNNYFPIVS